MRQYNFASVSFLILGVIYLAVGIAGTVMVKEPMLGLFMVALFAGVQGSLLIYKNDWVQSVTKVVCIVRLVIFLFVLALMAPLIPHFGAPGFLLGLVFIWDIVCLVVMIRTIDDVYFA